MNGSLDDWRYENADILSVDIDENTYEAVDIAAAAEQAKEITGIEIPSVNRYIIPVFEKDEPALADKYVFYKPNTGQIRWYDPEFGLSGSKRSASCETLATTEIGQRLQFWLPSYIEDVELPVDESELPPDQIEPTDRLSSSEQSAFFKDRNIWSCRKAV